MFAGFLQGSLDTTLSSIKRFEKVSAYVTQDVSMLLLTVEQVCTCSSGAVMCRNVSCGFAGLQTSFSLKISSVMTTPPRILIGQYIVSELLMLNWANFKAAQC